MCVRVHDLSPGNVIQIPDIPNIPELLNSLISKNQNQIGDHHTKIPAFTCGTDSLSTDRDLLWQVLHFILLLYNAGINFIQNHPPWYTT